MLHIIYMTMYPIVRALSYLLVLGTLLFSHLSYAAPAPDKTICNLGLTAVKLQDISFGSFVGASGGAVTIATDGTRTSTGGVMLMGGTTSAAVFEISSSLPGCEVYPVVITSPTISTLTESLGSTMDADSFVTSPTSGFLIIPGVPQIVEVGADLTVTIGQSSGTYNTLTPYSFSFNY